jgi:ubiquinone/menaquinone biosynthesis C-methylase UbiE
VSGGDGRPRDEKNPDADARVTLGVTEESRRRTTFSNVPAANATGNLTAALPAAQREDAMRSATSPKAPQLPRPDRAVTSDLPTVHAPRLRLTPPPRPEVAVKYDSEDYAMLNTPIETQRHVRRVMRYLHPRADDRLLEIGCGRGWLTHAIQQICPQTYGIDVNPRSIQHAVAANVSQMDAVELHYDDEQFDHVYSFHAIEHVVDADTALREMERVLVPGGRVLLVYPAEPIRGLYAMPGAWLGFGNPFLARRLHVHKFTPLKMRRLAADCGLRHVESALDFLITPQFMTVLEKAPFRP